MKRFEIAKANAKNRTVDMSDLTGQSMLNSISGLFFEFNNDSVGFHAHITFDDRLAEPR